MDKRNIFVKKGLLKKLNAFFSLLSEETTKVENNYDCYEVSQLSERMASELDKYIFGGHKHALVQFEFDYKHAQEYYNEVKECLSDASCTRLDKSWEKVQNEAAKQYPEVFGDNDTIFIIYGIEIPDEMTDKDAMKICKEFDLFPILKNKYHRYIGTLIRKGKIQFGYDWPEIFRFARESDENYWDDDLRKKLQKQSVDTSKADYHFVTT